MDPALLKKKRGGRAVILWKTRFVFDCVGAQQRQNVYLTCKRDFTSIVIRLDQCESQTSPQGIES